jgi:tetratricopeptide (TPR) repeat protein
MWTVVGRAALLLAGFLVSCMSRHEESHPKLDESPSSRPPDVPPPGSSRTPPPPPPPYFISFGSDLRSSSAYLKLLGASVTNEKLDRGCRFFQDRVFGKEDRRIEACEVRELTFDSFPQYLDAAQELTGSPFPCGLDDLDPKTDFDEKIRKKVATAIDFLNNSQGIKDEKNPSEERREKLARALYYFVDFPDLPERIQADSRDLLLKSTGELQRLGMGDFQDYLFKNGGLGTSLFIKPLEGDPHQPALEALAAKTGSDFTKSNILFAVLQQADLKPQFFAVPYKSIQPTLRNEIHGGLIRMVKSSQIMVGMNLEKKRIIFNPVTLGPAQDYDGAKAYSLTEYLGRYAFARGLDWFIRTGKFGEGIKVLEQGLEIRPNDAPTYFGIGFGWSALGDDKRAEAGYREALRLQPNYNDAHYQLGRLLYRTGREDEALQHYLETLQGNSMDLNYYPQGDDVDLIRQAVGKTLAKDPTHAVALAIQDILNKK